MTKRFIAAHSAIICPYCSESRWALEVVAEGRQSWMVFCNSCAKIVIVPKTVEEQHEQE
jgi:uncharacterized Zn finger protein